MRLIRFFWLGLLLAWLPQGLQAQLITASITITSAPVSHATITILGNTRTWTNDNVLTAPGTLIQQTNSIPYSATNLINHLSSYPAGNGHFLSMSNSANVTIKAQGALTVTVSAGWATVELSTNAQGNALQVRVPLEVETGTNRVRVANELVQGISTYATEAFDGIIVTNAAALSGAVQWFTGGYHTNGIRDRGFSTNEVLELARLTNAFGINGTVWGLTNGTYVNALLTNAVLTNVSALNGTLVELAGGVLDATRPTNLFGIHGTVHELRAGYYSNSILDRVFSTNFINYGNAISSPGTNGTSEQFGTGALANQNGALAVGRNTISTNTSTTAVGNGARAAGAAGTAIGASAVAGENAFAGGNTAAATGTNGTAVGNDSEAAYSNSGAFGNGVKADEAYQIKIGGSTHWVYMPGRLTAVLTNIAFAQGTTNQNFGDWADSTATITSLANGTNRIVATNVAMRIAAGPTAAFSVAGIDGGRDGRVLELWNDTGQTWTLNNESGVESVPANRILTASGADVALGTNAIVTLRYYGDRSRWVLRSKNP